MQWVRRNSIGFLFQFIQSKDLVRLLCQSCQKMDIFKVLSQFSGQRFILSPWKLFCYLNIKLGQQFSFFYFKLKAAKMRYVNNWGWYHYLRLDSGHAHVVQCTVSQVAEFFWISNFDFTTLQPIKLKRIAVLPWKALNLLKNIILVQKTS